MPDITMCQNEQCPMREKCYRYMAEPDPVRQGYAIFTPIVATVNWFSCEHYWPLSEATTRLRNNTPSVG